ncbi:MAG: recombination mediator RecR [Patescibacteria group bacterium]|nr:recombination mediator RecR [Patescibacteria group bacterium]
MQPEPIQKLASQLSKLPDIGPRAANRLVFYLINRDQEELEQLSVLIKNLKKRIHLCPQCFNIAESDQFCPICQDSRRDKEIICIVENVLNIAPIEKTGQYHGLYHILGGLISPADKIGPEKLKIKELIERIKNSKNGIKEIIFALSPTTEGDTTAFYIERLLSPLKIKTSRLARGLSIGSDLEYIDENTLSSALRGRK